MELNSEQQQIHDWIMRDLNLAIETDIFDLKLISLSGQAGVGKSFLTAQLIESIKTLKSKIKIPHFVPLVHICAPTHKAANNLREMAERYDIKVESSTIHSYLSLTVSHDPMTGTQILKKRPNVETRQCGVLLVDESSMISKDLFVRILEALKQGYCQAVVFCGDYFQIPCVLSKIDLEDPNYQKFSPVFSLDNQYQLNKIVRQAEGSKVIKLATEIRGYIERGESPNLIDVLEKHRDDFTMIRNHRDFVQHYLDDESVDKVIISYTNQTIQNYNEMIRTVLKNPQFENGFPSVITGERMIFNETQLNALHQVVHQNSQIVEVLRVKEEKFTLTDAHNTKYELEFYLCDTEFGQFNLLKKSSQYLFDQYVDNLKSSALNIPENEREKRRDAWHRYYKDKGIFQDVRYVYASTIHKSQGSTYDNVYIDFNEIIKYQDKMEMEDLLRLFYVAITRPSGELIFHNSYLKN